MRRVGCWCVSLLLLGAAATVQAELYRYIDNRGVTVLDSRVPPEFVSNGYEVLDSQGRVLRVIPAAPTREEREAARRALAEQERQRAADATLLRLYSNTRDLDRAHARHVAQIENLIVSARSSIVVLAQQRERLELRAATQQRAGRELDESLLNEIAESNAETSRLERLITQKEAEIVEVNERFAEQRERLTALLGE
jgi:chromosome segregation ATPase